MSKRNLGKTCLRLSAAFYGFYLAVELTNFFLHVYGRIPQLLLRIDAFFVLLLAQSQNLWVSAAVGVGFWLCHRSKSLRRSYLLLVLGLLVFIILDNVYYSIFFEHFRASQLAGMTGGVHAFTDSLLLELGISFYASVGFALAAALYIAHQGWPEQERVWAWRRSPRFHAGVAAVLSAAGLVSANIYAKFPLNHLNEQPLLVFAASMVEAKPKAFAARAPTNMDLDKLRFGEASLKANTLPALPPLANPNVVLIVLESVGAKQMLRDGDFDAKITPYLAKEAAHAVLFPQVYDYFPATVRSHVPLATGGRSITWGSTFIDLLLPYQGPTLVGQFAAAGYGTALFSAQDMDWENVGSFYRQLPFQKIWLPDDQDKAYVKQVRVNSWGLDERVVFAQALAWTATAKQPFFLELMSSSTHHPYSLPQDYKSTLPAIGDRWPRYQRALNFVDDAIGQVLTGLTKQGLRDNTIVVVMGDHGEAFGEWHPTNFTHQNHLYDENIRNFTALFLPQLVGGPYRETQIHSIGDIAPTLTALAGLPKADFVGRDMLAADYREKIVYFHKNAEPERWGLRDGRWKFSVAKIGNTEPELYDLNIDPDEQHNLAAVHYDIVRTYSELVPEWYLRTNADFTNRLAGYVHHGEQAFTREDMQASGPKLVDFGWKDRSGRFHSLPLIHPEEEMVVYCYAVPFRQAQPVQYEWTAPTGSVRSFNFTFAADWSSTTVFHAPPEPMAEGKWQLRLLVNEREVAHGEFTVSAKAKLFNRRMFGK